MRDAAYAWIRHVLLTNPGLLGRLLELCTGLRPPCVAVGEERGDELLLRTQGGEPPWYLLALEGRPEPAKTLAWPLAWLDLYDQTQEPGWLVVLTDSQEVMAWLEGPEFRPRYGVGILPLALDLTHQVEVLRRPGEPLLTALALFAARRRAPHRVDPIARQLVGELVAGDAPLLAVPLLRGARSLSGRIEEVLRSAVGPDPPRWWPAAFE